MNVDEVTLETNKSISDSLLWELQKKYYIEAGMAAWVGTVPYGTTSNPFIANSYAQIVIAFIRDIIASNPDSIQHPFYIIEPGAGPGVFSFLIMKRLLELTMLAKMENVKLRYIMCDIVEKNLQFHQSHPDLKPFIESGMLDFAMFELESTKPIRLQLANIELTPQVLVNPLIMMSNYVFDTTSQDAFYVSNQQIKPLLLDIKSPSDNLENGKVKLMDKLKITMKPASTSGYHYADNVINDILEVYRTNLKTNTNVLIPIGGFKGIAYLRALANNRLLLISTDKCFDSLDALENQPPPYIVFHGTSCFSMMVNYHAIKLYFEKNNGDANVNTLLNIALGTSVFVSGFKFKELRETSLALDKFTAEVTPYVYDLLYANFKKSINQCNFETIVSYLVLSHCSPFTFSFAAKQLLKLLPTASATAVKFLMQQIPKIAANCYYVPGAERPLFDIGHFCQHQGDYTAAIKYYQQALLHNTNTKLTYQLHYNLGLCYLKMKMKQEATRYLDQAIKLKPKCANSKKLLQEVAALN